MQILLITVFAIIFTSSLEARVFDFKNSSFGAFVGGSYGPSVAADMAYAGSSGSGVGFDQTEQSNYSGEFGFLASTKQFNFKVYAEYLFPKHLSNVTGSNAAGTSLYNLDTSVSALIPTAVVEFAIKTGTTWRWLVGGGYGFAIANLVNKYTFTTAGQSFGLSNFDETASSTAPLYLGYTGIEFQFTDIATIMLTAGYRYLRLDPWLSSETVTGFAGREAAGSTLVNRDGSNRSVNMSGPFGGICFRFYFF